MNSTHPNIDPAALQAHLAKIEQNLQEVPEAVLMEAKRRQDIADYNAQIEQAKRRKKTIKRFLRAQAQRNK
jgi:hypothetical protein